MRDRVKIDFVSLASGAVIIALGALVLLDSADVLALSLGWAAAAFSAGLGVILLAGGLASGASERHD